MCLFVDCQSWSPRDSKVLVAQSCSTLCDPMDCNPPGSSAHRILQARIWSGQPFPSLTHACMLSRFSHVQLCVTPWTAAHQAPLSMGLSRQEYQSGLPLPSPTKGTLTSVIRQTSGRHHRLNIFGNTAVIFSRNAQVLNYPLHIWDAVGFFCFFFFELVIKNLIL